MHKIYVDVPYHYPYKWEDKGDSADRALSREYGAKFTFICNSYGAIHHPDTVGVVGNKGDANMVEFESEKDELFFLLKTGWTKLNTDVVENYINTKRKR